VTLVSAVAVSARSVSNKPQSKVLMGGLSIGYLERQSSEKVPSECAF
jgi:hypothetical protein